MTAARRLLQFLFADDVLPVWLQVMWKALTWGYTAVLVVGARSTSGTTWPLYVIACVVFVFGTFTKLGDGRWG